MFLLSITEDDIDLLIRHNLITTKRLKTRGASSRLSEGNLIRTTMIWIIWFSAAIGATTLRPMNFLRKSFDRLVKSCDKIWDSRLIKARELDRIRETGSATRTD